LSEKSQNREQAEKHIYVLPRNSRIAQSICMLINKWCKSEYKHVKRKNISYFGKIQ